MVQGGYYLKNFEKHGALTNPYAFGYFPHAEHRGAFKGKHVTIGGLTYQADAYPASFRGKHIAANILSNAVYWYDVEPDGSTFATRHGGELLASSDEWFRPVDLTTGPDGCVYVADWYDLRASHNFTREDTWDKATGRIYRIEPRGYRPAERFALARRASRELIGWLAHPNEWYHREARRILAERRDAAIVPELRGRALAAGAEHTALEYLWALYASGGLDEDTARRLLGHPYGPVRSWTVRLLGDARGVSAAVLADLVALAGREPDARVRSQLAASARRLPGPQALAVLAPLVTHGEDARDPHTPLLVWWALERQVAEDPAACVELLTTPAAWRSPLARQHLEGRLARRLAAAGSDRELAGCARLLAAAPDIGADLVLEGIDLGMAGRVCDRVPAPLAGVVDRLWSRGHPSPALVRAAARLGSLPARERLARRALDRHGPRAERLRMIGLLGEVGGGRGLAPLIALLGRDEPEPVTAEVLRALGRFPAPSVADAVLGRYPRMSAALKERSADLLVSRKEWATRLLEALGPEFRRQPASRIRRILELEDPELTRRVEAAWGRLRPTSSAEKAEAARRLAGVIGPPEQFDKPGRVYDRSRGRRIFQERCAKCHTLFGEGKSIGPDLTGAERRNIETLTLSIVDPSAAIRREYAAYRLDLDDGRSLTGLILDPTPESYTLLDDKGERTVIARRDVRETREAQVSLMPDGLLDGLDTQALTDLFSYLTAKSP